MEDAKMKYIHFTKQTLCENGDRSGERALNYLDLTRRRLARRVTKT